MINYILIKVVVICVNCFFFPSFSHSVGFVRWEGVWLADSGLRISYSVDVLVFVFGLAHEDAHVGVNHILEVLFPRHIKVFIPSGFVDELFEVHHYLCALLDPLDLALDNICLLLEGGSFFSRPRIRHLVAEVLFHEVVLFLCRLQGSEAEVILHLQEVGRHILQQELKGLEAARLGCDVDSRVSDVVFLEEL